MALPYLIESGSRLYQVVDDFTAVYAAVVTGAVTDEILGDFLNAEFTVEPARNDLNVNTTDRGFYAITGTPSIAFPKLDSTSYTIDLVLRAPGFKESALLVNIPSKASFPVVAPTVAMRRLPVRIQGRVVDDSTRLPIIGALVMAVVNPTPPPPPPPVTLCTLLRSPLYFAHPLNTQVREVTLAIVGTAQLTLPVSRGERLLNLSTIAGLAGTAFVQLSTPSQVRVEYGVVDHLGPGPGQVVLRNPLNNSYGAGAATSVNFVNATLAANSGNLVTDADAGDGLFIADQLLDVSTVVVDPGSPTSLEYHEVGAVTDADGYYALDGMGRTRELFLQANPQVPKTPVIPWFIEYDRPVNGVDFRL